MRVSIRENLAGLRRVSAKLKTWGASMAGMGTKMAGVGAAMGLPMAMAVKTYADFDDAMRQVATDLYANGAGPLTEAQYRGLLDSIDQAAEGFDWNALATGAVSVALSIFGINRLRGRASESRGALEQHVAALDAKIQKLS